MVRQNNRLSRFNSRHFFAQNGIKTTTQVHLNVVSNISFLLQRYVHQYHLGSIYIEKAILHLGTDYFSPNICYFNAKTTKQFQPAQTYFPKPELVVEIVENKHTKIGVNTKIPIYQHHQIPEYWVVDVWGKNVVQYLLEELYPKECFYQKRVITVNENIRCAVIPGLSLPIHTFFESPMTMPKQEGLNTWDRGKIEGVKQVATIMKANGVQNDSIVYYTGLPLAIIEHL